MIDVIKNFISMTLLIPMIFIVGIYLSFKLRWLQITGIKQGLKAMLHCGQHELSDDHTHAEEHIGHKVSSFAALSAVLGGNLGTGNIAGIAVALTLGGPGALFWMWIMALLASIVKFVGCYLGVTHRIRHSKHGLLGGPMYYLANCLGMHKAAKLYCLFTICSAFTVGNFVQVNSVALPILHMGGSGIALSIIMGILVALVLLGGLKSFSVISATIVPFMAVIYLGACLVVLVVFNQEILPSLEIIFASAFNYGTLLGGVAGFAVFDAIRVGFDRGLFATDAGLGLEAMLHAQVGSKVVNTDKQAIAELAHSQGLVTMVAPIVVMTICSMTGLVLLVTGAWQVGGVQSTNMCIKAFEIGFGSQHVAAYVVIFTMFLFAFTTLLTWAHCAEQAIIFITEDCRAGWLKFISRISQERWIKLFRWAFVLVIPVGVYNNVRVVWTLADITLNLMLIINVTGVILLAREVIQAERTPAANTAQVLT